MKDITQCHLCGSKQIEVIRTEYRDVRHWRCDRCGDVLVAYSTIVSLPKYKSDLWLLSAFCRKRTKLRLPPEMIHNNNIEKFIGQMSPPANVSEAKNRIIKELVKRSDLMGGWLEYDPNLNLDVVLHKGEEDFIIRSLKDTGIIEIEGMIKGEDKIRLSPKGWEAYEELKNINLESNQVFIAMWYNEKTVKLREALRTGVEEAGYYPVIVDERHFTGNIMDYVLGRIRESKFVIADFTVSPEEEVEINKEKSDELENLKVKSGTRGGVYYEAGFAKGLGLEVIHTCKNDNISKNRLHFDVAQENTMFWNDEDVKISSVRSYEEREKAGDIYLSEQIFDRIISIFGSGTSQ